MERAYDLGDERLDGRVPPGRYCVVDPIEAVRRTYVVVGDAGQATLTPALRAAGGEAEAAVLTAKALKFLLLSVRTPEAEVLRRSRAGLDLGPASERAVARYWRWRLAPALMRYPTAGSPDPPSIARAAAAGRLAVQRGFQPGSVEELRSEYARCYGSWPFEETTDARAFYERDYFRVLAVAAPAQERLAASPLGRDEGWF
jgi:hypothetical protein